MVRPTRWWWLRHAPLDVPPGQLPLRDATIHRDEAQIQRLQRLLPDRAIWLTSCLPRAIDSARALTHVPAVRIPAFDEQDFGDWAGATHADLWASGDATYRAFWDTPAEATPPGGESFAAQCARVSTAIEETSALHEGFDIVAIAHAGTIRAALAQALSVEPARALAFAVDYWSLTRLDRIDGVWRVICVNRL
jgi:alpha-ribazole phosphatase